MESKFKVRQITKLYESCDRCGLPAINCICSRVPKIKTQAEIWVLCSEKEFYRPTNTARLIKLVNPESTEIILWERTKPSKELIEIINSEDYETYILFPDENDGSNTDSMAESLKDGEGISEITKIHPDNCKSEEEVMRCGCDNKNSDGITVSGESGKDAEETTISGEPGKGKEKIKAFILLDGTWKEAAKMYRKSDYLMNLPRISLNPGHKSEYTLRKGAGEGELCTIEAAIEVLKLNGEVKNAHIIKDVFELFMKSFKAGVCGVKIFK